MTAVPARITLSPAVMRALSFDRAGLAPLPALRSALGVATPLVLGAATGHPADGAMAAAGALPVGVAAMTGTVTAPTGLLLATSLGMAASTFVGSLCAGHPAAVLASLAVWGYVAGLFVVLGRAATITGVQAVVALIVFGRYPGGVATSAVHAAAVLAGGLLQIGYAVLLRLPRSYGPERTALSDLYQRLTALAAGRSYGGPSGEAIATTSDLLTRRAPDVTTLRDLLDEASRIRLELQALAAVPDVPGVDDVTGAAAGRLRRIARAVARGESPPEEPPDLTDAVDAMRARVSTAAAPQAVFALARAAALTGQLRAADRLTAALAGERRLPLPRIAGVVTALQLGGTLRGQLGRLRAAAVDRSSPAFRHAVRLAVLLPLADVLARHLPWQRGYWVPLTAVVVLKPDYATTVQRGAARVIGTGLGVVLAGLLVAYARPTGAALVLAAGVLAWASYTLFAASYAMFTFVLTALVVLLISTGDPKPLSAVADRGLDTLLGGALALSAYIAWPTREAPTLRTTAARLLVALADYAETVFGGYVAGRHDRSLREVLAGQARAARRARADAQASFDRALAEPARLRPRTDVATSVLAASRRTVVVLHALRTTLQDAKDLSPLPEVAPVGADVVTALRELADAVRESRAAQLPALREGQQELVEIAATSQAGVRQRRLGIVAAHLDALVDAIDTIGHVLADDDRSQEPATDRLVRLWQRPLLGRRHGTADEVDEGTTP